MDYCAGWQCYHEADHSACDDGQYCTGEETCDVNQGCLPGTFPCGLYRRYCNEAQDRCDQCRTNTDCNDGHPCTQNLCNTTYGDCYYPHVTCNDNNACTNDAQTWDYFNSSPPCCSFTPKNCSDNNACTTDSCNPATGCMYASVTCNDNNLCTTDSCNPTTGCVYTPITCSDGNACTSDTCNPASGCSYPAVNCNDGLFCNGVEGCNPASGCTAGISQCAGQMCDEGTDTCFQCTTTGPPTRNGIRFDGRDDYVRIGSPPALEMTDFFTVEAWILPQHNTYGIIVNKENEYEIARFPDGKIYWAVNNNAPGWTWINTGGVAPLNQWTHVAWTFNYPTTQKIRTYINGILVHDVFGAGPVRNTAAPNDEFRIGGRLAVANPFAGVIDEVRIWNVERTAAQIQQNVNAVLPGNAAGLKGYWRFEEGAGAATVDAASANAGTLVGAAWTINGCDDLRGCNGAEFCGANRLCQGGTPLCPGKFCDENTDLCRNCFAGGPATRYALRLDGRDDYLRVSNTAALEMTSALSLEAWIMPMGPGANGNGVIIGKDGEYLLARYSDGKIWYALNNTSPGFTWVTTAVVAPINAWSHVVLTYDSSQVRVYLNGSLIYTGSATGPIRNAAAPNDEFRIGVRQAGSPFFYGVIDNVRVWNIALNDDMVENLAANGVVDPMFAGNLKGWWKLDEGSGTGAADAAQGNAATVFGAQWITAGCADDIFCTIDACDAAADVCSHTPDDSACDDGVPCTRDECDAAADGFCANVPEHERCSDGVGCNGVEVCDSLLGCQPGVEGCDDGLECTADRCEPVGDKCVHVPDDARCDDGIPCTIDVCDDFSDNLCANRAEHSLCDDGNLCTDDVCDRTVGCLHNRLTCDDQDGCTGDACIDFLGCTHESFCEELFVAESQFLDSLVCDEQAGCPAAQTCVNTALQSCEAEVDACFQEYITLNNFEGPIVHCLMTTLGIETVEQFYQHLGHTWWRRIHILHWAHCAGELLGPVAGYVGCLTEWHHQTDQRSRECDCNSCPNAPNCTDRFGIAVEMTNLCDQESVYTDVVCLGQDDNALPRMLFTHLSPTDTFEQLCARDSNWRVQTYGVLDASGRKIRDCQPITQQGPRPAIAGQTVQAHFDCGSPAGCPQVGVPLYLASDGLAAGEQITVRVHYQNFHPNNNSSATRDVVITGPSTDFRIPTELRALPNAVVEILSINVPPDVRKTCHAIPDHPITVDDAPFVQVATIVCRCPEDQVAQASQTGQTGEASQLCADYHINVSVSIDSRIIEPGPVDVYLETSSGYRDGYSYTWDASHAFGPVLAQTTYTASVSSIYNSNMRCAFENGQVSISGQVDAADADHQVHCQCVDTAADFCVPGDGDPEPFDPSDVFNDAWPPCGCDPNGCPTNFFGCGGGGGGCYHDCGPPQNGGNCDNPQPCPCPEGIQGPCNCCTVTVNPCPIVCEDFLTSYSGPSVSVSTAGLQVSGTSGTGLTVDDTLVLNVSGTDADGVGAFFWFIDGQPISHEAVNTTNSQANSAVHQVDASALSDGHHVLTVWVWDFHPNFKSPTILDVPFVVDHTPTLPSGCAVDSAAPSVAIVAPQSGSTLTPGSITLMAEASDTSGIRRVEFLIDGSTPSNAFDTTAPYTYAWNATEGQHTLRARAFDNCDNVKLSATVNVTVAGPNTCGTDQSGPTVSITSPQNGAPFAIGPVDFMATSVDANDVQFVAFFVDGVFAARDWTAPYAASLEFATPGQHQVRARSFDECGNQAWSDPVTVEILSNPAPCEIDVVPPQVSINSPGDGVTVPRGVITLQASAFDNVGVNVVVFEIDGEVPANAVALTTPYRYGFVGSRATHVVRAHSMDHCGNSAWSDYVTLHVANQQPRAAADSAVLPATGSITIPVIANDWDPDGDAIHLAFNAIIIAPARGQAVKNIDNTITYTPGAGFTSGTDQFRYRIVDSFGTVHSAIVTVSRQ